MAPSKYHFPVTPDALHAFVAYRKEGLEAVAQNGGQVGLARQLCTDLRAGRSDTRELEKARIETFGRNELPPTPDVTFFELAMESLEDPMMRLLIGAAILSLILGLTVPNHETGLVDYSTGWIEGTAILLSVVIVTLVTSVNNYQKEQKFKELSAAAPPSPVLVTRGGKVVEIPDSELLVGDLVHLKEGQIVPVDCMLVKATDFKADESAASGENDEIPKAIDEDCMLKSGSNVIEGEGIAIVTAVGVNSFSGRISMECREKKKDTPLQEQLSELADQIGNLGMAAAVLMFVVLSLKELYESLYLELHPLGYKKFLDVITTAITIVVVAVPEGLPLSVTIALAYSMKQMFRENNLVRHLVACETMGGATTICTDKTGTLTQNVMTVMQVYVGHKHIELDGTAADAATIAPVMGPRYPLAQLFADCLAVNSSAAKKRVPGPGKGESHIKWVGNKTEMAMLMFLEKANFDPMALRGRHDPNDVHSYPFTSNKKRMTTVVREEGGVVRWQVKGASEMVLELCDTVHCGAHVEAMSAKTREEIAGVILSMARNRLRTIAIATATTAASGGPHEFPREEEMPRLTLLAIVGIEDPIRVEVPDSVERCRRAGVSVRMVTGDNKATAISIAKKAGIYGIVGSGPAAGEQGLAMEGKVFRELAKSNKKLNVILPRLQVLARASPMDKRILVGALMERGEVVAVTGDGTNDAPALKSANVGFAMNTGTDVAKSASDVVILDDNFRSIVTAMKWGRNVNDNISKFIQFQTTVNVAAVTIAFVGAIFSGNSESPLKPVQLLWLNLIMDTMAALALATEPPAEAVLHRPPRGRDAPLINRRMWTNIFGQSVYQIALQLWILHNGFAWFGVEKDSKEHMTVVFNVFVLLQVFNEFNARILDGSLNVFAGLSRAPMFLAVVIVTVIVQVVGVTYGGAFMHSVPLPLELWGQCTAVSAVPIFLGVFLRMIPVKERPTTGSDFKRRDDDGNTIEEEDEEEDSTEAAKPPMTFQRAAYCVIAQLKVVGALAERQSMASNGF